ncbi:hypothetical protein BDV95DRAFT_561239 [Massariosphaeria phaeospora]|uniref:Uncharacterized protein n=1 Tax=Massariosphaeria phaeospora TaxID=100035 RepID=A0A7C8ID36_9PLEO|nr:hypothetical protein BDV95DRAFT_561239 [Massariosphaeria phaeospora]
MGTPLVFLKGLVNSCSGNTGDSTNSLLFGHAPTPSHCKEWWLQKGFSIKRRVEALARMQGAFSGHQNGAFVGRWEQCGLKPYSVLRAYKRSDPTDTWYVSLLVGHRMPILVARVAVVVVALYTARVHVTVGLQRVGDGSIPPVPHPFRSCPIRTSHPSPS